MLFQHLSFSEKPEVINMNILFNSKNIRWNKETLEYEEIEEELIEEQEQDDIEEELEEQESESLKMKEPIIKKRKDVNDVDDEEG
jgi:predicted phosphoribosyltransferase